MLETLGYRVLMADNGKTALEIYRQKRAEISLVILDLIMPLMDGPETFHRLREIDPDVRVLLSSGYTHETKMDALLLGAVGFLQKPYDIEQLSEKLTTAVEPVNPRGPRPV
jgi:CheY-like chemotaxis protein